MNDDHITEPHATDAALEARLVAWVLGEASAFEAAELERLVAAQPQLALFKRRIEAVHGLLGEASAVRKSDALRLDAARRASLLATFGVSAPASESPPAAVIQPAPAKPRRRSFSPEWKALRLYFGTAAACVLVFFVVQRMDFLYPQSRSAHVTMQAGQTEYIELPAVEEREFERRALLQSVESADLRRAQREAEQEKARIAYEKELTARELELVRDAIAVRQLEEDNGYAPAMMMDATPLSAEWSAAPVTRVGAGRASPGINLERFEQSSAPESYSEPETVPEGDDDQRITLEPFEIKATRDAGYTASATLAGSRIRTDLRDVGSAVTFGVSSSAGSADSAGGRVASSYKSQRDLGSSGAEPTPREASDPWSTGFAQSAVGQLASGGAVSVVTQEYLHDTGASDNQSLLHYTANTEVGGAEANFSGRARTAAAQSAFRGQFDGLDADGATPPTDVTWSAGLEAQGSRGLDTGRASGVVAGRVAAGKPAPMPPPPPLSKEKPAPAQEADKKLERAKQAPAAPVAIDEAHAAKEPVSTFSLHVSDASFKVAQAALARGEVPDAALIRPEEFYNAFDYGDPSPTLGQKMACRIEQAAHPFLQQRNLVRVAMKVASTGRGAGQPLRLTVLLDTSGSMEREDRAASVARAMEVLASLLGPNDRVTLLGFARQPRLLAEALTGDKAAQLVDLVRRTPADGGTNIEEALKVADQLAQRLFDPAAQNRIVLLTDGAANLGNADPAQLAARIEGLRGRGIAFDACGVGTDGLDDEILEALTRRGDGRYYVLDSPADADGGFARQLAGAFRPAAKNVKVQVRFNPARVGAYRLLGFEKHRLREEDFRNDRVDAAELAAEEAAVAVYQVEVLPQGEGDLGEVFVRFRDMESSRMVERAWPIAHDPRLRAFEQASPSLQLAGTAAMLAEVLRGGALGDQVDLDALAPVVNRLKSHYAQQPRVLELATMFEQLRRKLGR